MKRLYAAVPLRFEDDLLKTIGRLGAVQLVSDYTIKGFRRVENLECCERYIKLQQRIASILSSLPPEKTGRKSLLHSLKETFSATPFIQPSGRAELREVESYVSEVEARLDQRLTVLESLRNEINRLEDLKRRLLILKKHNLRIDQLGDFRHIFVKAGLMQRELTPRLRGYTEGTSVSFTVLPETKTEDFLMICGLNEDRPHIDSALTLLNFSELTFPSDIDPHPAGAVEKISSMVEEKRREVEEIERGIREIGREFRDRSKIYEPTVWENIQLEEARSNLSRTSRMSLIHGWVPAEKAKEVSDAVLQITSGTAFVKLEDPGPKDKPPVRIKNRGPLGSFELLVRLRGLPDYREIDPTPLTAILFSAMFGLMFGDVGNGLVLTVIGLIFLNLHRDFLKIPAVAIRRLGGIIAVCGVSSMFFGALFGEVFLLEGLIHPVLFSPFHNQSAMMSAALVFGIMQIALGLVLKVINMIRKGDLYKTLFSGVTLLYYVVGVLLALRYTEKMSLSVFTENLALTAAAVGLLAAIFFYPVIE
ncbi:MAG: V-type ATPase 116kDa subunit family protein, partial [Candidatus Bathyarchaeia archaeon]